MRPVVSLGWTIEGLKFPFLNRTKPRSPALSNGPTMSPESLIFSGAVQIPLRG